MAGTFTAVRAAHSQFRAEKRRFLVADLNISLGTDSSTGAVSAFAAILSSWGAILNDRWKQQQNQGDHDDAQVTAAVLSRVSSWWIYANHDLISAIDNSADVAAAAKMINDTTAGLTKAEENFKNDAAQLTSVAKTLDGLFTFFKGVAG